jgi:23S rRNA pseudouridine2604 synthase
MQDRIRGVIKGDRINIARRSRLLLVYLLLGWGLSLSTKSATILFGCQTGSHQEFVVRSFTIMSVRFETTRAGVAIAAKALKTRSRTTILGYSTFVGPISAGSMVDWRPSFAQAEQASSLNFTTKRMMTVRFFSPSPACLSRIQRANDEEVRLSKRMSELDLCSRREADRWITMQQQGKGATSSLPDSVPTILVRGKPIFSTLGQKVSASETSITLKYPGDQQEEGSVSSQKQQLTQAESFNVLWERVQHDTIVLHKPLQYLSGQPDAESHHKLAVKLLTPQNYFSSQGDKDIKSSEELSNLPFERRQRVSRRVPPVLEGYVPAGRLDINSTGLLIFTRNGVVAKKLVAEKSSLDKEYIVKVTVRQRHMKDFMEEIEKDKRGHSRRTFRWKNRALDRNEETAVNITPREFSPSLSRLKNGGQKLQDEPKPLKRLPVAEWVNDDTLRLVLREGKKRQIRRMCSEIMGFRVISLERVRVGALKLENLPVGKWRLLNKQEVAHILDC